MAASSSAARSEAPLASGGLADAAGFFRLFVVLAENKSLAATSRALGLTPSAVSKSISRQEARLGVRLVNRSTHSLSFTAEGLTFLDRCRRILAEIEAAELDFSEGKSRPVGRLRISLPQIEEPFIHLLAKFKATHPEVELDVDFTDRAVDVIDEGFDLVIRSGDMQNSRLISRPLGTFRMLVVASPEYLNDHGAPASVEEIGAHQRILFRSPLTGKLQPWPGIAEGPKQMQPIVCNNTDSRMRFALHGAGLAYLPEFAIKWELWDGRLISVLPEVLTSAETLHVLWPPGRQRQTKTRALVDFLVKELRLWSSRSPDALGQPEARLNIHHQPTGILHDSGELVV